MKKLLSILFILLFSNINAQEKYLAEWNFIPSSINKSLLQNNITGIQKDNAGFLWISTQFGIYRYDGHNILPYSTGTNASIASNRFSYILNKGNDLITIDEKATYRIQNGQIEILEIKNNITQITNNGVYLELPTSKILAYAKKEKRIGSTAILYFEKDTILIGERGTFNINQQQYLSNIFLKQSKIYAFFNAGKKVYFVNEKGLQLINFSKNKLNQVPFLSFKGNNKYIQHDEASVWIQQNRRLIKINLITGQIEKEIALDLYKINEVASCFEDQRKMYIGTTSQGVYESSLFKGDRALMQNKPSSENYIYSYAFDSTNQFYYSLNKDGLFQFNPYTKKKINVYNKKLNPYQLQLYNNKLLFGNQENDIIQFDLKSRKTQSIYHCTNVLKKIEQFDDSSMIITEIDKVYLLNIINKKRTVIYNRLDANNITTSLKDYNNLWIGLENSLLKFDLTSKKITTILSKSYVRTLLKLDNDKLIIGTYGMGAYLYQNNKIIPLKNDPAGISSAVVAVSKDMYNNLWILCNKGAFLWKYADLIYLKNDPKHNQYHQYYATNDQIPSEEINGGQIPTVFPSNTVVLPSSNGLLILPLNNLTNQIKSPNITTRYFAINQDTIYGKNSLNIPAKHDELTIQLDFPLYESSANFNVQYKIEGLHKDWRPLDLSRKITLNQLNAGNYQLLIKTGSDQVAQKVLQFEVNKFWYTSYIFFTLFGLMIIACFFLFLKIRTKYLRVKQLELEKIIHDNTKLLKEQIKVITHSEKEINKLYKHSNKLYSILMHDLKSPLQFLSNYAIDQLKLTKLDKKSDPDALQTIASTSSDLFKFINEFLYWLQKQNKNQQVQLDKVDLIATLKDIVQLYEPISSIQNNRILYFPKPATIFVFTDPDLLKIIFRNLIDNANKYTNNGVIKLSCESNTDKNIATIIIQDSGQGLPDYVIALMAQETIKQSYAPSINANHKMGIQITKEFIHQINGTLEVSTSKENGTVFKIHLPLYTEQETITEKDGIN